MLLADRGQFTEAVRRLKAVPPAARTGDDWELLGRLNLSAGNLREAEEDLVRALQAKPESVELLRQLGGIALKRNDPAKAGAYLARALRIAPNSPELLYEYSQVALQNKLSGEAVLEMRKAILTPEVKARLEAFGLDVAPTDGPQLAAFIQKETAFWHALIKQRHLTLD